MPEPATTSAASERPTGVVLAGGAGRRFGTDKGAFAFEGLTLVERAGRALDPLCTRVVVSLAPGARNPAPEREVVTDAPPAGRGPLAGLLAAWSVCPGADLLVLACDYPWVDTDLLRRVAGAARATDALVLPVDGAGREHPLVALWRAGARDAVERALAAGRSKVGDVVAALVARRLRAEDLGGVDLAAALVNVNRLSDLDRRSGSGSPPTD